MGPTNLSWSVNPKAQKETPTLKESARPISKKQTHEEKNKMVIEWQPEENNDDNKTHIINRNKFWCLVRESYFSNILFKHGNNLNDSN